MLWFGSATRIETIESNDALTFYASRQRRVADFFPPLWAAGFIGYGIHLHSSIFVDFAAIGLVSAIAFIFRTPFVKLHITRDEVTTQSIKAGSEDAGQAAAWSEVIELSYLPNDEDHDGLLRVKLRGSGSITLLRHIKKVQAEEIIDSIYRRFPDLAIAPGFSESGIISLGLSSYNG